MWDMTIRSQEHGEETEIVKKNFATVKVVVGAWSDKVDEKHKGEIRFARTRRDRHILLATVVIPRDV
jgi:hypothetical protein